MTGFEVRLQTGFLHAGEREAREFQTGLRNRASARITSDNGFGRAELGTSPPPRLPDVSEGEDTNSGVLNPSRETSRVSQGMVLDDEGERALEMARDRHAGEIDKIRRQARKRKTQSRARARANAQPTI